MSETREESSSVPAQGRAETDSGDGQPPEARLSALERQIGDMTQAFTSLKDQLEAQHGLQEVSSGMRLPGPVRTNQGGDLDPIPDSDPMEHQSQGGSQRGDPEDDGFLHLLSVTCLMNDGYNIEFNASEGTCLITRQNLVIGNAKLSGNLWVLDTVQTEDSPESPEDEGAFLTSSEKALALWHLRFNHLNEDELRRMARSQAVKGLDISDLNGDPVKGRCEGCARGKQHRHPFPSSEKKDRSPLELIHSDLVGPLVETVQTKKKYILTFIDDCTRRSWVYLLGKKSETFQCFKQFQKQVERQSGHKIKILRSDGGGEYIDKDFLDYLTDQGIVKEFSMAYTPQQDGSAERFNRTMVEASLSMLHGAGISTRF